jgi:hypothetical protein
LDAVETHAWLAPPWQSHSASRITRSGRRTSLRIAENWPWTTDLVQAFDRLAALPRPIT